MCDKNPRSINTFEYNRILLLSLQNYTLLDYFRNEMSGMFEDGLDNLNESNNTMIRLVNRRVDEIQQSMHAAMHDEGMMDFMKLAVGMPMLGIGLSALGAPVGAIALTSVVAPLYLLGFLSNGASEHPTPSEIHHIIFNVSLPANTNEN